MKRLVALLAALLAVAAAITAGRSGEGTGATADRPRLELAPGSGSAGFAHAREPRRFRLPADHGPHYEYQTEWWYYTGQLASGSGRRFGFQLTFFRRGLSPGPPPDAGSLATNQVYFAHLAITDAASGRHVFVERVARGAGGLAGASGEPFAVWLENWKAEARSADGSVLELRARDRELSLGLTLEASKPLVLHGDRGLSAKGDAPGNASYYVGYTRLAARGEIAAGGEAVAVSGEAWFDHEWSTSALGTGAVGWDWFSLQLDGGRELMYFQIRREDGSVEPVSGGTLVAPDGSTRRLAREAVALDVLSRWTSPETGGVYPSRWRLRVPGEGLDLLVEPWLAEQEMRTSFLYWEGAVSVSGTASGRPVTGRGYVEMTGYARSFGGVF
jgi:predicted secreted hydrolase